MRAYAAVALMIISISAADVKRFPTTAPAQLKNAQLGHPSNYNVRIAYGNAVLSNWTLSQPILITRVQVSAKTVFLNYDSLTRTYSPCGSPTPQLLLSNGATSVAYNLPNLPVTTTRPTPSEFTGTTDSGIVSVPFPTVSPISMKIIYNKASCNVLASEFNINVQYTPLRKSTARSTREHIQILFPRASE